MSAKHYRLHFDIYFSVDISVYTTRDGGPTFWFGSFLISLCAGEIDVQSTVMGKNSTSGVFDGEIISFPFPTLQGKCNNIFLTGALGKPCLSAQSRTHLRITNCLVFARILSTVYPKLMNSSWTHLLPLTRQGPRGERQPIKLSGISTILVPEGKATLIGPTEI